MARSDSYKQFSALWVRACKSMWVERTALRNLHAFALDSYRTHGAGKLLTDLVYAPDARGRIDDLDIHTFLDASAEYLDEVVSSRIVLLSAALEAYLLGFLEHYLLARSKYRTAAGELNAAGNKFCGEVRKERGPSNRIMKFAELAPSKIKSIEPLLPALSDVYVLRNVIAHCAGVIDARAASQLQTISCTPGMRVSLSPEQLLELAKPTTAVAKKLDEKIGAAR